MVDQSNFVISLKILIAKIKDTTRHIASYTHLNLEEPIYRKTTNYGHFGKKDLS